MKFVLAGGSGQVGGILKTHLEAQGHAVVILGRNGGPGIVAWDGRTLGPWARELDGADVVFRRGQPVPGAAGSPVSRYAAMPLGPGRREPACVILDDCACGPVTRPESGFRRRLRS